MCVFITAGPSTKLVLCVFITAVPVIKLFAGWYSFPSELRKTKKMKQLTHGSFSADFSKSLCVPFIFKCVRERNYDGFQIEIKTT